MTSEQAQHLQVKPGVQLSLLLERCCLRVSANVSDQHAAEDVELFTGMRVSAKTQQRLVQRQLFDPPQVSEPVGEASLDGGTVRLIVESGQQPAWKQSKAVHLAPILTVACKFRERDGNRSMSPEFWLTAVLISIISYEFSL